MNPTGQTPSRPSSPTQPQSVPHMPGSEGFIDHIAGTAVSGPMVVEYGDFECPSCAQAYPAIKMLKARFHDGFRFAFRHYPITSAHPHALLAAEAAEAAGGQGRFWEMHDLLFENWQHLTPDKLRQLAQTLSLDMTRFDADLADHIYLQRVQEHIASADACRVRSTPAFFVDGQLVDASFGIEHLAQVIAQHVSGHH